MSPPQTQTPPPLYAKLRPNTSILNPHLFAGIAVTASFIPLANQHPYLAYFVPFIFNTILLFLSAIYLYLSVQVPWDIYLYALEKESMIQHQDTTTIPIKSTPHYQSLPSTPKIPAVTASASCSFHASFTLSPSKRYDQYMSRLAFFGSLACPLLSALVLETVRHRMLVGYWVQYLDPIVFILIAMTRPLLHLSRSIQQSSSDAHQLKSHNGPRQQYRDPIHLPVEEGSMQATSKHRTAMNVQSTTIQLPNAHDLSVTQQSLVQLKETRTYLAAYLSQVDSMLTKMQHTHHLSAPTQPVVTNTWLVFPIYQLLRLVQSIKTWPSVLATCVAWLILRCLRSLVECLVMPVWVWRTGVRVLWFFVTWIPRHVLDVPLRLLLRGGTRSNNWSLLPASPSS